MTMAIIKIKSLWLRTFIGLNSDELINKQDVTIHIELETDISADVLENDEPDDILDYKIITKNVIDLVQNGRFKLLEVLTKRILDLVLSNKKIKWARVEVDKPHALRYSKSVSLTMEGRN